MNIYLYILYNMNILIYILYAKQLKINNDQYIYQYISIYKYINIYYTYYKLLII